MKETTIDPTGVEADCTWIDDQTIRVAWMAHDGTLMVADYDATTLAQKAMVRTFPSLCVFPRVSGDYLAYKTANHDGWSDWGVTLERPPGTLLGVFPPTEWASGNNPADLSDNHAYFAHTDKAFVIHTLSLPWLHEVSASAPGVGGSTGIEQLLDDGTVITRDAVYGKTPGFATVFTAGPFILGENTDDAFGNMGVRVRAGNKETLMFEGKWADEPRGALHADGRLAIVCGIAHGCFLGTVVLADLTRDVPPPPPPTPKPSVKVRFAPSAGPIPLKVVGTISDIQNATTWRWLRDSNIDQPIDGLTHDYTIKDVGDVALALRVAGPGGTMQTDPVIVTARPPAYMTGYRGVVAWGMQETADTYNTLHQPAHGFDAVRLNVGHCESGVIRQAVLVPKGQGLRPIVMIWPMAQLDYVPEYLDVECGNEADVGKAPMPKLTPGQYATEVLKWYDKAKANHQRLWTAGVSNTGKVQLAWVREVRRLLPRDVGIGIHFYPPKWNSEASEPHPDYRSWQEMADAILAAVDGTPFILTETGWLEVTKHGWFVDFPFWPHSHTLSEAQVQSRGRNSMALWKALGAGAWCWYQMNGEAGIRDADGSWDLVSFI